MHRLENRRTPIIRFRNEIKEGIISIRFQNKKKNRNTVDNTVTMRLQKNRHDFGFGIDIIIR